MASSRARASLLFAAVLLTGLVCGSLGEDKGDAPAQEEPEVCDFVEKMDHYERLGVSRDADDKSLKKQYRKLSLQYHPDKNKGKNKDCAQKHFIAISKAYEVLSDPERRKKFDTFGDIEEGDGGFGQGGADPFSMFQQFFERSGGFPGGAFGGGGFPGGGFGGGGFGGGGGQFFVFEDDDTMMPQQVDISDCVHQCVEEYRLAGYGGDLEGHCLQDCELEAQQAFGGHYPGGGGFEFEFPAGGFPGGGFEFEFPGGGFPGGGFQGGGFQGGGFQGGGFQGGGFGQQEQFFDDGGRASILEHMMRSGGDPAGQFRGGGGGDRGQTEHILVEDQYGNQFWQEMEVDDGMDDEYAFFGGGGGGFGGAPDPYERQRGHMPRTGGGQKARSGRSGGRRR